MPWVRYDDQFSHHPKVSEVKLHDRTALTLHLLCGTWSASTSTPGLVSEAATVEQAGSKQRAKKWAKVLVDAKLWHAPGHDCDRCPAITAGFVIHDWKVYNPHEELARKRSDAGRKGAAARWGNDKSHGNAMANAISEPSPGHSEATGKRVAENAPSPSPFPYGGSVDGSPAPSRRANDDDSKIDERIIELLAEHGGRVTLEWAAKVRRQILSGRDPRDRAAYVAAAIRGNPRDYLPTGETHPSSRSVSEAIAASMGDGA